MSDKKKERGYLETNHRVLEVTMGDGKAKFYPQKKMAFLIWRPIMDPEWAKPIPQRFTTLAQANQFLSKRQMEIKGTKVVKRKAHPFNLVFHKLKQTDNE